MDDDTIRKEGNDGEQDVSNTSVNDANSQNNENSIDIEKCENDAYQGEDVIFNGPEEVILENVNVDKKFPRAVYEPPLHASSSGMLPSKGLSAKVDSFIKAQGQKVVLNNGGSPP